MAECLLNSVVWMKDFSPSQRDAVTFEGRKKGAVMVFFFCRGPANGNLNSVTHQMIHPSSHRAQRSDVLRSYQEMLLTPFI